MITIWQNTQTGENRIFENITRERARQTLLAEYGKETIYNEWKWYGNFYSEQEVKEKEKRVKIILRESHNEILKVLNRREN